MFILIENLQISGWSVSTSYTLVHILLWVKCISDVHIYVHTITLFKIDNTVHLTCPYLFADLFIRRKLINCFTLPASLFCHKKNWSEKMVGQITLVREKRVCSIHRYYNTWIGNGFRGPNIHCSCDVGTLEPFLVIHARKK